MYDKNTKIDHQPILDNTRTDGGQSLLSASSGWQPIETAPKDGTEVLIWPREITGTAIYSHGEWVDPNEEYAESHPTHWMPMPAGPTE
jgi:hypothetical protein